MKTSAWNILSGSALKMIAMISMLIDHGALILLKHSQWADQAVLGDMSIYYILRRVGRLAFPIFCFLLVEGFVHTRNRKKYALSLLAFAIVSEIPFDMMTSGKYFSMAKQNIYFTLLLGVLFMWVIELKWHSLIKLAAWAAMFGAAEWLKVDYGVKGVLLIALLYVLREHKVLKPFLAFPMLSGGYYALCAFVPISMYNGERGFIRGKAAKYAFYIFYPVHILVLLWIKFNLI